MLFQMLKILNTAIKTQFPVERRNTLVLHSIHWSFFSLTVHYYKFCFGIESFVSTLPLESKSLIVIQILFTIPAYWEENK